MYALPDKRNVMTEYAKEFIYSKPVSDLAKLATLFKVIISKRIDVTSFWPTIALQILRYLKISNTYICDGYWSKVQHEIQNNASERENYILARHCHRYMHFNNNLGGTYRHKEFEKYVVSAMVADLNTGITAMVPAQFSKVASFILAYGHTPNSRQVFPEFIISKIESMAEQFRIIDSLQISRGIQIALQMRY